MPDSNNDYCGYFLDNKEDDSKIFYLNGFLFCTKENCEHNNHVGKTFRYELNEPLFCECATNGLITDKSELASKL